MVISMALAGNVELPNVKFVSCDGISLPGFDKCLSVKFSYLEEYAGLKEQGSPDVLVGKLYGLDGTENEDSRVSASFESDSDFFVMIHDPSDEELYKLKVDLQTGETQTWVLPADGSVKLDHVMTPPGERSSKPKAAVERAMPSQGFRMTVQPMVDQSFRNQYGSNVQTRVNAIMEHAKTFFVHGSLQTKFELDIKSLHNYPNALLAGENELNTLVSYVRNSNLPLVNTYSLISMRGGNGIAGIAWLGTVCGTKAYRTNINEYYGDLDTAQILVHEIGHNLNMGHDFRNGNPNSYRFSSTGEACTAVNGYMDYRSNPNRWSPCSVEDMTRYYNQVGPDNYGSTCMTLLSDTDPTTAAPTTAAPTNAPTNAPTDAPTNAPTNPPTNGPTNGPTNAPTNTPTNSPTDAPTNAPTTVAPTSAPGDCPVPEWVGDGWCDDQTNTAACNWDGGDCCNNTRRRWWKYCSDCLCLDPREQECKDTARWQRFCDRQKNKGRCNQKWVRVQCQLTCGYC